MSYVREYGLPSLLADISLATDSPRDPVCGRHPRLPRLQHSLRRRALPLSGCGTLGRGIFCVRSIPRYIRVTLRPFITSLGMSTDSRLWNLRRPTSPSLASCSSRLRSSTASTRGGPCKSSTRVSSKVQWALRACISCTSTSGARLIVVVVLASRADAELARG